MKTVSVVVNTKKDPELSVTRKVISALSKFAECILINDDIKFDAPPTVRFVDADNIYNGTEAVVTIGGDGTILRIAPEISRLGIPVLGINLGRIGFMAELEVGETELVSKLFSSEYMIDSRMMLDVDVIRDGNKLHSFTALNEVVIMNGSVSRMTELDLFCNEEFVSSYHADGLILSTPTGSTAYSLSAGGAVIDPSLECILITPVCAHSFHNSRPMVFSSSAELTVKDVSVRDENTYLTLDGNRNVKLSFGDNVLVKKSQYTIDLIKIKSTRFYNTVYTKLSERR